MLLNRTFRKGERLHGKKLIDRLFKEGGSFFIHPFKVVYLMDGVKEKYPVQVLVSVSKRNIRKATDRNKLKRLIREAYRLNKEELYRQLKDKDGQLIIGLIYTGRTILSFTQIESKIILILQRLIEQDEQAVG
jgi:ribonuclease P protein component